ncbi:restriction endonuclease subunit S [Vibrio rotiferianus]|uniref:restriction endonuclease subunit S n=1 Tax=Vibrio rotiferianus TaxID=190895 RepID=UPI00390AADFC
MNIKIDKSSWKKVRLGDVATEHSKRIGNPSESGFERFVGNSNIGQWDFRVKNWDSTSSVTSAMKLFEPNDYLLVRRSLYASDFRERAPRAHFSGVCSGDILTIRENPEFIADGFLIGILNSPELWKYVVANASGSITRRIKWKDLAHYEFLLPPLNQQKELSSLLWSLDDEIYCKERVVIKLENAISVQFENDILKFYDKHKMLSDALSGISAGKSPNAQSQPAKNNEKGVLKVSAVGNGVYIQEENKSLINESDFNPKFEVKVGFILVTRANANPSGIGRPCYVRETREGLMLSDKTLRLIPNSTVVRDRFLFQSLRTKRYRKYIESVAGGTEAKNISQARLLKAPIILPSLVEQSKIEKKLLQYDESILDAKNCVIAVKELKKSIINQVF